MAAALALELRDSGIRSHEIVGWLEADGQAFSTYVLSGAGPHLGQLQDVRRIVKRHRIDLLVSCPVHGDERTRLRTLETVAETCLDLPVRMIDREELYEELLGRPARDDQLRLVRQHPSSRAPPGLAWSKRALDLCLGAIGSLFAAPILAAAAIAIKLDDGGPVLYRQRRVGRGPRVHDAEAAHDGRRRGGRRRAPPRRPDDERATRVGQVLRRSHLDELPQLWNVLRGEMALVGPRPERRCPISELEREFQYFDRRHLIKPGITGWAQVRCGYAGSDAGGWKLCHDLFYLKHRSFWVDLVIVAKTFVTVARGLQYGLRTPNEHFIARRAPPLHGAGRLLGRGALRTGRRAGPARHRPRRAFGAGGVVASPSIASCCRR